MSENNMLESINNVMSKIDVPENQKKEIENELMRYIISNIDQTIAERDIQQHKKHHHHGYSGEFMQELNHVNIKLLYIPLLQINSGTTRLMMPLTGDDDDDD